MDTLFGHVCGDSRKRRGDGSSIRRAQRFCPRQFASDNFGTARARHQTTARNCACVRTRDRPTNSRCHLSDVNVSDGFVYQRGSKTRMPARRVGTLTCSEFMATGQKLTITAKRLGRRCLFRLRLNHVAAGEWPHA